MRLLRRLAYWLRHRSQQAELDEELAMHRELIERDFRARGLIQSDARDAARRAMGNETSVREDSRGVWICSSHPYPGESVPPFTLLIPRQRSACAPQLYLWETTSLTV